MYNVIFTENKNETVKLLSEDGKEMIKIIFEKQDDNNFHLKIRTLRDVSIKPISGNAFDLIIEKDI